MAQFKDVCLITGGSRGIGAALARHLASPQRAIWVNFVSRVAEARQLCANLLSQGGWAQEVRANVADRDAVRQMMASIQAEHGRLDILVHCAAAALAPKPFLKLDWSKDLVPPIEVACRGLLNCLQEAAPLLGPRARVVVLLTDALFHRPPVQMGAYLAAKGALWGIARAAAKEMQRKGTTFAFVSPGMTKTELVGAYGERALELFAQEHPLGRLAEPKEIAAAIAALLEAGEYLNGANLMVNGGTDF